MEHYFAAKLRLFSELLPQSTWRDAVAVVRGDDPFGRRVLDAVKGSHLRQVRQSGQSASAWSPGSTFIR